MNADESNYDLAFRAICEPSEELVLKGPLELSPQQAVAPLLLIFMAAVNALILFVILKELIIMPFLFHPLLGTLLLLFIFPAIFLASRASQLRNATAYVTNKRIILFGPFITRLPSTNNWRFGKGIAIYSNIYRAKIIGARKYQHGPIRLRLGSSDFILRKDYSREDLDALLSGIEKAHS